MLKEMPCERRGCLAHNSWENVKYVTFPLRENARMISWRYLRAALINVTHDKANTVSNLVLRNKTKNSYSSIFIVQKKTN